MGPALRELRSHYGIKPNTNTGSSAISHLLVAFESATVEVGIRMLIVTKKKIDNCTCSSTL